MTASKRLTGPKRKATTETVISKSKSQPMPKLQPKSKCGAKKKTVESSDESDDDAEEWLCLACCEPFNNSRKGEQWTRCVTVTCECCAHVLCTGLDSTVKTYVCDN